MDGHTPTGASGALLVGEQHRSDANSPVLEPLRSVDAKRRSGSGWRNSLTKGPKFAGTLPATRRSLPPLVRTDTQVVLLAPDLHAAAPREPMLPVLAWAQDNARVLESLDTLTRYAPPFAVNPDARPQYCQC